MKPLCLRKKKGFTLVELVIASAFTTIIVALIFSMFLFGNKTFDNGKTQNNIQNDLRLASDVIRDEVRYASDLSVISAFDGTIEADKNYIYISADDKSIILSKSGVPNKNIVSFSGSDVEVEVLFSKGLDSGDAISYSNSIAASPLVDNVLKYTIIGTSSKMSKEYEVKSDVIIMNMKSQISNLNFFEGPIATPGEGSVPIGTIVTLLPVSGSKIYYTMDGTKPDITKGIEYTGPITLSMTTTIKAIAIRTSDSKSSSIAIYEYTVLAAKPSASGIIIAGVAKAGNTLTVTYTYRHDDGVTTQGASKIEWFYMKNGTGSPTLFTPVSYYNPAGLNNFIYNIVQSNKGDSIYVVVTPVDKNGVTGNAVQSDKVNVAQN